MEICVDSVESAVNAAAGGATRLLVCSAPAEGGLTPTVGLLRAVRERVHIDVFCMVRCRPGYFTYSFEEISNMKFDAKNLMENGADGIAFGALTVEGAVDKEACELIMEAVPEGAQLTFNRAFDWTKDPTQALLDIHSLGRFTRILTSGHAPRADEGMDLLKQLVAEVTRSNFPIKIVPARGVTYRNIDLLRSKTGCVEFHSSASALVAFRGHRNPLCSMGTQNMYRRVTQKEMVATMAHFVKCSRAGYTRNDEDEYRAKRARLDETFMPPGDEEMTKLLSRCNGDRNGAEVMWEMVIASRSVAGKQNPKPQVVVPPQQPSEEEVKTSGSA